VAQAQRLANHAADRQADEVAAVDAQPVQQRDQVVGQTVDGVGARRAFAAAVAAQVHAQHAVAGRQQRRHLFGPQAQVGRQ
jgi:hypothetical protein